MENALKNAGARTEGIEFISKVGGGLDWFKTVAYPKLYSIVKNETASILAKPTAVVINLGINDLENQNGYVLYMNSIAKELKKHNCELFFMSLNPVNRSMLKEAGKKTGARQRFVCSTMPCAVRWGRSTVILIRILN